MLKNDPNEGLLNDQENNISVSVKQKSSYSQNDEPKSPKKSKKSQKGKSQRSEVTYILKVLNFLVGGAFIAFAVYCYLYGIDEDKLSKANLLKYIMPAYVGISGLIILLIECRIGFVIRNLRFFYNYFGRGVFNIYAGVMPLTMISNFDSTLTTFQIITVVAASVMCLVGVLYICLKIFCCEKEGDKIDKHKRQSSDSSD